MRLMKITVEGIPRYTDGYTLDLASTQRRSEEAKERTIDVFDNISSNPVVTIIGKNAGGKTSALKLVSFFISLINSDSINDKGSYAEEIFRDLNPEKTAKVTAYIAHEDKLIKLVSVIKKKLNSKNGTEILTFENETIYEKKVLKSKPKKDLYTFEESHKVCDRLKYSDFLKDDDSIAYIYFKKAENVFEINCIETTNHNLPYVLGNFPIELIEFFDPQIESLKIIQGGIKEQISLKFKNRDPYILDDPLDLKRYLSSGTIKGLTLFTMAKAAFDEGGILIIDELEKHFSHEMIKRLIEFFYDKEINKKGATLIFSTHWAQVLEFIAMNDSIYLAVNTKGTLDLQRFSTLKIREDINKADYFTSGVLPGSTPIYNAYIKLKRFMRDAQLTDRKEETV